MLRHKKVASPSLLHNQPHYERHNHYFFTPCLCIFLWTPGLSKSGPILMATTYSLRAGPAKKLPKWWNAISRAVFSSWKLKFNFRGGVRQFFRHKSTELVDGPGIGATYGQNLRYRLPPKSYRQKRENRPPPKSYRHVALPSRPSPSKISLPNTALVFLLCLLLLLTAADTTSIRVWTTVMHVWS